MLKKKTIWLVVVVMVLVVVFVACGPKDSPEDQIESKNYVRVPFSNSLPMPPKPNDLPTELFSGVEYIEPPVNCSGENDPNVTCSTLEGQSTKGDFILPAGHALVMTGDGISILDEESSILLDRPNIYVDHDLWLVVNDSSKDVSLYMSAPFGSFRGYFSTLGGWNVQKMAHLRDLHLYLFLLPKQTEDRFEPTPVPNCDSKFGCRQVNVRGMLFVDTGRHPIDFGIYDEKQPFWQNLLQNLGQ